MKTSKIILSGYNLLLAIGAIYCGVMIILGNLGEYPVEWLNKLPFIDWIYPGVIMIILYGIGNLIASVLSFIKNDKGLLASAIMGVILLVSTLVLIKILGEVYLATYQFIVFSIIQIALTIVAFIMSYKNKIKE